jgi:hypothetical protein
MTDPKRSRDDNLPVRPPGGDNSGVLILLLLAVAAFCGWYIVVRDHAGNSNPLPVVEKPIIPPTTIDTSAEFPGHKHYTVFGDKDQTNTTSKQ